MRLRPLASLVPVVLMSSLLPACFEPLVRVGDGEGEGVGGGGGGLSCGAGLTVCGTVCVNLQADDAHCGACNAACGPTESCAAGTCYPDDCSTADCSAEQVCDLERCKDKECFGVTCPMGKACFRGECLDPTCRDGGMCPPGRYCHQGQCIDPWCVGVLCPPSLVCVDGACTGCVPGAQCTPSQACWLGQASCDPMLCTPAQPTPPGISCGAAAVCDGDGGCNACDAGAACLPTPGACMGGVISCGTGASVCGSLSPLPEGTACPGGTCAGDGGCNLCLPGASCSTGEACVLGAVSCADGGATCQPAGVKPAGTSCGADGGSGAVCGADGGCNTCVAGAPCTPPLTCMQGQVSCATGEPVCVATTPTVGAACDGGYCRADAGCGACVPGLPCSTGNACERGITDCMGTGEQRCIPMGPLPAATVCRAAAGVCDRAEACDGVSLGCPSDGKLAAGTACGSPDNSDCNAPDSCDGVGNACVDRFKPSTTVCRVGGSGNDAVCNPAETCTGSSAACPNDVRALAGAACGSTDATACNAADSCDGNGTCVDRVKAAGAVCRGAAGVCDQAESCNGASAACPNDGKLAAGTSCGSADNSDCNAPDSCDGVGNACVNRLKPATTVCRAAAGVCDQAESCTGMSPTCPGDGKLAAGTACGDPSNTDCNAPDSCDGSGNACVARFKPSTHVCRVGGSGNDAVCNPAETCTGASATCPADFKLPVNSTCPGGVCSGTTGVCVPCVPGAACTPANVCANGTQQCVNGMAVCNVSSYKPAYTTCGVNRLCDGQGVCCQPGWGGYDQTSVVQSANAQYRFRSGWCSFSNTCEQNQYTYSQSLRSENCVQAGSMGTCFDDDAIWFVECNAVVQCQYSCNGTCVPTFCN